MNNLYIYKIDDAGERSGGAGSLDSKQRQAIKRMPKILRLDPNAAFFGRNAKKIGRNANGTGRNALLIGRDAKCIWPNAQEFRRNALIFLFFLFCVCLAQARQQEGHLPAAIGLADTIKPLNIGDTIPEALWNLSLQLVKAGQEGRATVKLQDYKGKLIILDFWATWCAPCVAAFPKMDSIQMEYPSTLKILLINCGEHANEVKKRLGERAPRRADMIFNDTILRKAFPFSGIPHHVWIGPSGTVVAITGGNNMNSKNIAELLASGYINLPEKKDLVDFDLNAPLWLEGNGRHLKQLMGYSFVMHSIKGIHNSFYIRYDSLGRVIHIRTGNRTIPELYGILVGNLTWYNNPFVTPKRRILEVKNKYPLELPKNRGDWDLWREQHTYFYETELPEGLSGNKEEIKRWIRQDLERYFPYKAKVEKREQPCILLGQISSDRSIRTKGGKPVTIIGGNSIKLINQPIQVLIAALERKLGYLNLPFIDDSGINYHIDLEMDLPSTLEEINHKLEIYGLRLISKSKRISMLVLKDREGLR